MLFNVTNISRKLQQPQTDNPVSHLKSDLLNISQFTDLTVTDFNRLKVSQISVQA